MLLWFGLWTNKWLGRQLKMKRYLLKILTLVVSIFIFGCDTTTKYENTQKVETKKTYFNKNNFDIQLSKLSQNIVLDLKKHKEIKNLGIQGFLKHGKRVPLSEEIEQGLSKVLVLSGVVKVFERSDLLKHVKEELEKQHIDFYFDNLSAKEIGRFSPIDTLITGKIFLDGKKISISVSAVNVETAEQHSFRTLTILLNSESGEDTDFYLKHPLIYKAEQGDLNAVKKLAKKYFIGEKPFKKNIKKFERLLLDNANDNEIQAILAILYTGKKVAGMRLPRNIKSATYWANKVYGNSGESIPLSFLLKEHLAMGNLDEAETISDKTNNYYDKAAYYYEKSMSARSDSSKKRYAKKFIRYACSAITGGSKSEVFTKKSMKKSLKDLGDMAFHA